MIWSALAWCWKHPFKILFLFLLLVGVYGAYKPLPEELGMSGTTYQLPDSAVTFLSDETYLNQAEERVAEQTIFAEIFGMIAEAEQYILVDMFLWNPFQGASPQEYRLLSSELTEALIQKKQENPTIAITVVSDPINTVYAGQPSYQFEALAAAGIPVIITNHSAMRDSNPLYSSLWRGLFQWPDILHTYIIGAPYTGRWLPNVMDNNGEKVTLRSYLKLFNFKANHRKLIVADAPHPTGRTVATLVTSANPHDGSSMHSNVALRIDGGLWRDAIVSEQMVAAFSGGTVPDVSPDLPFVEETGEVAVRLITEMAIQETVLEMLGRTGAGDSVELAMFYLSEDKIIDALIAASNRGATVRVILDANKDAFGMEKNGVPNRPVAARLIRETEGKLTVRWCATHGEQCHSKLLMVSTPDWYAFTLGSANFTRRNLKNSNLETNVVVESAVPSTAFTDARAYFDRMWNNEGERLYTLEYEAYKDEVMRKRLQSWLMENTGLSTF